MLHYCSIPPAVILLFLPTERKIEGLVMSQKIIELSARILQSKSTEIIQRHWGQFHEAKNQRKTPLDRIFSTLFETLPHVLRLRAHTSQVMKNFKLIFV